jgi:hypothetical protein
MRQLAGMGFPSALGGPAIGPFGNLGDHFRGATAMMKGLYRQPDKVLAALE